MNYEDFKTYLTDFLWKRGDTVVIERLDQLIKMAESELDRDLKVSRREMLVTLEATSDTVALPADCREVRKISKLDGCGLVYYSPHEFANLRRNTAAALTAYTTYANNVRLLGNPTVENPVSLLLHYYARVPSFQTEDASWLEEEYLDVFTYTVLKHSAPFLREDERLAVWGELYKAAMVSAMNEDERRKYAGSPIKIVWPSNVR